MDQDPAEHVLHRRETDSLGERHPHRRRSDGELLEATIGERLIERVDLHLHLDGPLTVNVNVLTGTPPPPPPPASSAVSAVLTFTGDPMTQTALTVDSVNGKVSIGFLDDKGDVADAPATGSASWSTQPSADGTGGASTLAQDASDPWSADITVGPEGDAGFFAASFGGTVLEADGITPMPDPSPIAYGPVAAGLANSAALSES